VITVHQRYRQIDGRTTTYHGNTALLYASRSKNVTALISAERLAYSCPVIPVVTLTCTRRPGRTRRRCACDWTSISTSEPSAHTQCRTPSIWLLAYLLLHRLERQYALRGVVLGGFRRV